MADNVAFNSASDHDSSSEPCCREVGTLRNMRWYELCKVDSVCSVDSTSLQFEAGSAGNDMGPGRSQLTLSHQSMDPLPLGGLTR